MHFAARTAWALVLALLSAACQTATAADYTPLRDAATGRVISLSLQGYKSGAGVAKSAMAVADVTTQARAFVVANATLLGVSAVPGDLIALSAEVDKLGLGHQRFALRYGSLPVYGGEVYVHVDGAAGVYYATTKPMGEPPASLVPVWSADEARSAAVAWAQVQVPGSVPILADGATLVILPLRVAGQRGDTESKLVWQVRVASDDAGTFDERCFVDAGDGAIAFHFSNIAELTRQVYDCNTYPSQCAIDFWRTQYQYYFGRSESKPLRGPHPIPGIFYGSYDVDRSFDYLAAAHDYYLTKFGRNGGNNLGGIGTGVSGGPPVTLTREFAHLDDVYRACPKTREFQRGFPSSNAMLPSAAASYS